MSPAPDIQHPLHRIDRPDFAEALAADTDGTFAAEIQDYLDDWHKKLKGYQDAGLSSEDFDAVTRLSRSIQTAKRVTDFFARMQKLPPTT